MASPRLHNTPALFLLFAVICFITFYQSGVAHLVRELDVSKKVSQVRQFLKIWILRLIYLMF